MNRNGRPLRLIMPISRFVVELIAAAAMVIAAGAACGEEYPSKPIRMLTAEPGGGSDFVARLIAQGLSGIIGQRVVVDNRGIIAAEISARAQPDGYTLLLYGSPLWLSPFMRDH